MKSSAIVCAVLAGSFGLASVASAAPGRGGRDDDRNSRFEQRQDRREARAERRDDRRDDRRARQAQRTDRAFQQGYRAGSYQQPRPVYAQPSYTYTQPSYRSAPRFHRGGYLPAEYRRNGYYVNNWNAHSGLYAPPYGHQWVQVGSDFLLVALATGLIANLLTH
jgi:Ni/Co efflux regulator RcnB